MHTAPAPTSTEIAPAPWRLVGCGAILVLAPRPGARRLPTPGALAFVDYAVSGVDPYLELLHIPRFTHRAGQLGPTLDRIWVTSQRSVDSGRANWAIPKDLAAITREGEASGRQRWTASRGGEELATLALAPYGPPLPVAKPRGLGRLLQRMNGVPYATPVSVRGTLRLARVEELRLGPIFGDVAPQQVKLAVIAQHFVMGFHAAERR